MVDGSRTEIEEMVKTVLVPLLQADGGTVYIVQCTDQEVSLHLTGRYSGCPGNTLVTRNVIEPAVRALAPDAMVNITYGAIVPDGAIPA